MRAPGPAEASLRILEEETIMGVVVQTRGIAARFAPDHFIHAGEWDAELAMDPDRPEDARFHLEVPADELVADHPEMRARVGDRLLDLGLLDDPYDEMSADDRQDVRDAMLADDQLHADEHPVIAVELVDVRRNGEEPFNWEGTVAMTVRGVRAEAPFQARLRESDGRVEVEGHAGFRFTDFEIEPYRAFLGAVQNRDDFTLYLTLAAEPDDG